MLPRPLRLKAGKPPIVYYLVSSSPVTITTTKGKRAANSQQSERHQLHDEEKQWLIDAHIDFIISQRGYSPLRWEEMDWGLTAMHFNEKFEGEYLP